MTNKQKKAAIHNAIMEGAKLEEIADMIKTPEEWNRYYDRFKDEYASLKERGICVGQLPSKQDFKEQWARGYKLGAKEFKKNPMRQILESQKIVSQSQAEAWREGFTTEKVMRFLSENQRRRDAFAEWQSKKENEGQEYGLPTGIYLTKEQEKALKQLAKLGPQQARSQKFMKLYEKVKDVMKDFYKSIPESQRKSGKGGKRGSWFYEIWYLE